LLAHFFFQTTMKPVVPSLPRNSNPLLRCPPISLSDSLHWCDLPLACYCPLALFCGSEQSPFFPLYPLFMDSPPITARSNFSAFDHPEYANFLECSFRLTRRHRIFFFLPSQMSCFFPSPHVPVPAPNPLTMCHTPRFPPPKHFTPCFTCSVSIPMVSATQSSISFFFNEKPFL